MLKPFQNAFMKSSTRRQEKPAGQTGAEAAGEGAARLGRFGKAMKDEKKGGDAVSRIQAYAKSENERKQKEEAEKKKKAAAPKSTAPEKGFFGRMIDKYYYGKKEEQ